MDALADLPDFPGTVATPERETFRARMLARDAETLRDRQRQRLELFLSDTLQAIKADDVNRRYLVGAALAAQAMDIVTTEEAAAWIDRAWEASRAR